MVVLGRIFFWVFTIEMNSAIANNLKPIGMMKIAICDCLSKYLRVCFLLYGHLAEKKQDSWGFNTIKWEQFQKNMQIVQIIISNYFATETISVPIVFRLFAIAQLTLS